MESKSHGKREDSSYIDTLSTSSDGKTFRTYKSLYDFSPHLHRPHKRAKSLKASLKKANIDFPDVRAPYTFGVPLSPLPEPVEEDESEDSYDRFRKKRYNRAYDAFIKMQRDLVEDLFQLQKRSITDYIQENLNEPPDLGSVKETEEENAGKDVKRIYSLHDLSKDLRKLRYRSDLFEEKEISLPRITATPNEVNAGIKESDSEYEVSSEEATSDDRIIRTIVLDRAEPLEKSIEKVILAGRGKKTQKMPDTIEEEAGESEPIADRFEVMNKLQKSHQEANFVVKLMKWDNYPVREFSSRARSLSFDIEEIKEEEAGEH